MQLSTRRSRATAVMLTILAGATTSVMAAPASESQRATAVFAGGCFWCLEQALDAVRGVVSTTSGYTGGRTAKPTYEEVSAGNTGHMEAVQVVYDPSQVGYEDLLKVFWHNVDPVDGGGQFCDRGSQYQSAIFFQSTQERRLAERSREEVARDLHAKIATLITPAGEFYAAEAYHQDYYSKNPARYKFYKWNCGREQRLKMVWEGY
ncbi:MAG: peptide-methionine (S)-S-oxide reductase MsrA [Bryobacteraceae bacterium]